MPRSSLHSALARSLLAGEAALESAVARLSHTLGKDWRWLRPLVRRYLKAFGTGTRPRRNEVVAFLANDQGLQHALERHRLDVRIASWLAESSEMQPVPSARSWRIPRITTERELAEWLHLSPGELEWFADRKRIAAKLPEGPLCHYHYRVLAKSDGTIRVIEAPQRRLKELQQKVLREILEKIPIHQAAHAFIKRRSIKTFAAPHIGRRVVLRMDMKNFFPSISEARVNAFFRTAGYPESVASLLAGICTNSVPHRYWTTTGRNLSFEHVSEVRDLYSRPHLPQGASTSPAFANLCAYRLDCRLSGLAKAAGAEYTRYADDLAFSGDEHFERGVERFAIHVAAILMEEGFTVHHRKTRIMRQGVRQHLAGVVTNQHLNIVRRDFDRLKATLKNCALHGPQSQNRTGHPAWRSHLAGKISFVAMVNPAKGVKLRRIFDQITW